jgi:hypothetical protein
VQYFVLCKEVTCHNFKIFGGKEISIRVSVFNIKKIQL